MHSHTYKHRERNNGIPLFALSFVPVFSGRTPDILFSSLRSSSPPGVVNILSGHGPTAGEPLAKHPDVRKVAFTGSTVVGKKIQGFAAPDLKHVSLELGGKSPMIVLDDADIDEAVSVAQTSLFLNMGQCCCAGSRLFVQEGIYDKFVKAAVKKASAQKVGGFTEKNVELGPIVDKIQFEKVLGYIEKGKAGGATVATGGERQGDKGYFVQPTVFTGKFMHTL